MNNDLVSIVAQWVKELEFKQEPKNLYAPINYSLSLGGKRLRPVLCVAACKMFIDDIERVKNAAMALEMFHNFTLLHDDVMDNAAIRRGQPTVAARWNDNTAILSGDEMLVQAYKLIAEVDSPVASLILDCFSTTASEVCQGQQYDMDFETRRDVTLDEYMEMIRLKTAVLLAASIKIGALVGGANLQEVTTLYNFGINIGLAFQLQDDLLDTYGNEKTFGKAIGGDIMEAKKTYLLINALEAASATQKRDLWALLDDKSMDRSQKVAKVTNIFNALGVKEKTEAKIDELMNEALKTLRVMEISAEGKRTMLDLVQALVKRDK